jgi:hypothetical protein
VTIANSPSGSNEHEDGGNYSVHEASSGKDVEHLKQFQNPVQSKRAPAEVALIESTLEQAAVTRRR